MSNFIAAIGKKKNVDTLLSVLKEMEKKEEIAILATTRTTKKKMLGSQEELKILFRAKGETHITLDKELVRSFTLCRLMNRQKIVIKMTTFQVEDKWLRWKIKEMTVPFQTKGGEVRIQEEVEEDKTRNLVKRKCVFALAGPPGAAIAYMNLLIQEKVADPNTVEYIL